MNRPHTPARALALAVALLINPAAWAQAVSAESAAEADAVSPAPVVHLDEYTHLVDGLPVEILWSLGGLAPGALAVSGCGH